MITLAPGGGKALAKKSGMASSREFNDFGPASYRIEKICSTFSPLMDRLSGGALSEGCPHGSMMPYDDGALGS
jgi:hypothetical protein